jgi:hypothetical protein
LTENGPDEEMVRLEVPLASRTLTVLEPADFRSVPGK